MLTISQAMVLRSYEGTLSPANIYSLLALVAANSGAYTVCSQVQISITPVHSVVFFISILLQAFVKLESLKDLTPDQQKQYESLGVEIFRKYAHVTVV